MATRNPSGVELEPLVSSLEDLCGASTAKSATSSPTSSSLSNHSASYNALTPAQAAVTAHRKWWSRFFPSHKTLDDMFAKEGLGTWVVVRATGEEIFEEMPIYVRLGMHLLFFHSKHSSLLRYRSVGHLLEQLSIRQGKIYDDESDPKAVLEHISTFVKTYSIPLAELLLPDLKSYPSFNSFFARKLKPGARPIADPNDSTIISSAADCRLTVFASVEEATRIWIKGKNFSIASLLDDQALAKKFPPGSSLAIFRLAPADYHRFHSPVGPSVAGKTKHIKGEYLTVNATIVNEDFDVFTANRRDVMMNTWSPKQGRSIPYAFIAIGAMLVGSIHWSSPTVSDGLAASHRGQELGWFQYGGSTCIAIFPPQAKVRWDHDLLNTSLAGKETIVQVGERIGQSFVRTSRFASMWRRSKY